MSSKKELEEEVKILNKEVDELWKAIEEMSVILKQLTDKPKYFGG